MAETYDFIVLDAGQTDYIPRDGVRDARAPWFATVSSRIKTWMITALVIVIPIPSAAESSEPSVGDLVRVQWDGTFKGWTQEASGTATRGQGYVVFKSDKQYLITITRIIESKSDGSSIQEILKRLPVTADAGEESVPGNDCEFLAETPVLGLKNTRTGVVRGYFTKYEEVVPKRWFVDERQPCTHGRD